MPCQTGDIQEILADDHISRLVYYPAMFDQKTLSVIHPLQTFQFKSNRPESVVWRTYARNDTDVHDLGIEGQRKKRERKGNMEPTYKGFITAGVEGVRGISIASGRSFLVEHAPCEGVWHAEIKVDEDITKKEKAELRLLLFAVFDDLVEPTDHETPAATT